MRKIRVLIVDDAVVVRRLISDTLSEDPAIEIAGVAANGKIALNKIENLKPDILLLDLEMPEMDGMTTIRTIRKTNKSLPIIVFSTLTERGALATLDALSAGANDYVTKPANVGSILESQRVIREELSAKVKALCKFPDTKIAAYKTVDKPAPQLRIRKNIDARIDAVVIGISTGGPNALEAVIPNIPGNLSVPILIVQHMPPVFTKSLADRLNSRSQITVVEAEHEAEICPSCAYIAPGGYHLTISKKSNSLNVALNQDPPENSCRPAADVLFRSAAKTFNHNLLAVVMTGMGQDGLKGCHLIAEAGGQIIVQDETSSVVWGMPGFVAREGLADKVLPLDEIAPEIAKRASFMNSRVRVDHK